MHILLRERMNVPLLRLESFVNNVATFFWPETLHRAHHWPPSSRGKYFSTFLQNLSSFVCVFVLVDQHAWEEIYLLSKVLLCKNPLYYGTYFVRNALNQAQIWRPFLSLTIQLPAFHSFATKAAAGQKLIEERMPPPTLTLTFPSTCVKTFVKCRWIPWVSLSATAWL